MTQIYLVTHDFYVNENPVNITASLLSILLVILIHRPCLLICKLKVHMSLCPSFASPRRSYFFAFSLYLEIEIGLSVHKSWDSFYSIYSSRLECRRKQNGSSTVFHCQEKIHIQTKKYSSALQYNK